MKAFLTGSHAYGKPTPASDIDLVILCSEEIADLLNKHSESKNKLQFGQLNILVCTTEEQYQCWLDGTRQLKGRRKPQSKADAITLFKALRQDRGITRPCHFPFSADGSGRDKKE